MLHGVQGKAVVRLVLLEVKMKRRIRYLLNEAVALLLLAALVACNVNYRPSFKESITDAGLRSRVSRVIDTQMENIKEYLDEDLRTQIEEGFLRLYLHISL